MSPDAPECASLCISGSETEEDYERTSSSTAASCPTTRRVMMVAERRLMLAHPEPKQFRKRGVANAKRNRLRRKYYVSALEEHLAQAKAKADRLESQRVALLAHEKELSEQATLLRQEVMDSIGRGTVTPHINDQVPKSESTSTSSCESEEDTAIGNQQTSQHSPRRCDPIVALCCQCSVLLSEVFAKSQLHDHGYCKSLGMRDMGRSGRGGGPSSK